MDKFPKWDGLDLVNIIPDLTEEGHSLMKGLLNIEKERRLSSEIALKHPFFNDIDT
jgi:hypothetical protein